MFKSIFSKLLSVNYLTILISFIIMGVLLFSLLGDYVTAEKKGVLQNNGKKVSELTVFLLQNKSPIVESLYRMNLESYGTSTRSFIFVIDQTGTIFAASSSSYRGIEGQKLKKEQYEEVLQGNNIDKIGNFGGMFSQTVLTVGVPIIYNDKVVGGVFLSSPIPEINRVKYDVFRMFMTAVSVAIIAAFIIIYFLSRSISKPLKEINKVAKTIASGQFENRVFINSQDEIGELGRTFNDMAVSLQNLENMRRSFVANVSHELRTPMTTISGFIEGIMDETIPPEKQPKYLHIVLDEMKRLSRLVNDLLDLAKMEAGEKQLDIREFDVNEMIRIAIIKFENRITQKDIHINAVFDDEHSYVKADMDGIQRVITNLLDNAIKFCDVNGKIDIGVLSKDHRTFISIMNDGIGIDEQEIKYIWDRFYKTDKSRSKDKMGTGLGLAIVKNIIHQHGQEIWVESRVEEFTKFTFTLERARRELMIQNNVQV